MHVTFEEMAARIRAHAYRDQHYHSEPIGLHGDPKRRLPGFMGVGPVCVHGETSPSAWFDVYVGHSCERYDDINKMVQVACRRDSIPYINMR